MKINIERELERLSSLKLPELKREYEAAWGEPTRSNNRPYLIKRVAWRLQAIAEGGLSDKARRRAADIARDEDLRMQPPPEVHVALRGLERSSRRPLPPAGTVLRREYLGRPVEVTVLDRGFLYQGTTFKSLTAVAGAPCSEWPAGSPVAPGRLAVGRSLAGAAFLAGLAFGAGVAGFVASMCSSPSRVRPRRDVPAAPDTPLPRRGAASRRRGGEHR